MFLKNFIGIFRKANINIAIVGGSNSVMRRGYAKYLDSYLSKSISQFTRLNYYSLGGVPNIFGSIQQDRYNIASNNDIIFFEYCVNDRYAIEIEQYSLEMAGKSLEGFIRKCRKANPNCQIVILIFGINLDNFYDNHCALSELYESVGSHYRLPVINLTKLLAKEEGLSFVKSLYSEKDHAHYTRPHGVQIISQVILEQLEQMGVLRKLKSKKKKVKNLDIEPIYPDNYEKLAFFESFESGNFFTAPPKISVYQNTVFREKNYTIEGDNSLKFWLKGQLVGIYVKSDSNDGFINIEFGSQRITTSSYSSWVNAIKPQNVINLIISPLREFSASEDFAPVSISLCQEYPKDYEIGFNKCEPTKQDPQKWKLSIIGVAYIGEIKAFDFNSKADQRSEITSSF